MTPLKYRVLELSWKHKLSHIGSCISCVDMIDAIYEMKKLDEPFLLGNAHAGLALYVVLEKIFGYDAEKLLEKHGIHATRDLEHGIFASGGSLGQLETVAVGAALADRSRNVWLLSSDGSMQEGACWEALMIKRELRLSNLKWYINCNGYAAYKSIDSSELYHMIQAVNPEVRTVFTDFGGIPFLQGLSAHYYKMNENDWKWVQENKP